MTQEDELKQRILNEMTISYSDALEKNFEVAKKYFRLTKTGKVDIPEKDKLKGEDQVLLYLIGKLYAKRSGLATKDCVENKELIDELGIPEGSLYPWVKKLRDEKKIETIEEGKMVCHKILANWVERVLKNIEAILKKP